LFADTYGKILQDKYPLFGKDIYISEKGAETMQYDELFWSVFETFGMPEAYINYKYFSQPAAEIREADEGTPAT